MPAPISVILPTLDAGDSLGPTLAALAPGLSEGLLREVIVSDGGSADATAEIADAVGARLIRGPRGRGSQIRAGAAAARGDWLLILHADTVLSPNWPEAAAGHMRTFPDAAGWFRLRFDESSFPARWTAGWANLRSRAFALPYGDQGLLISRALYDAIGGCPPIPLMEDVAMARRLGRRRLRGLGATAVTSAIRYRREGWLRRGLRNWRCLILYYCGAAPERIARRYQAGDRENL